MLRLFRFVWRHPLNATGKVTAIGRVLRWQVGSRLLPGAVALPFVEGTQLFVQRGMTGATGNWYCGLHEVAEMGFVLHTLQASDHFLDVGANIGSYSIIAAGAVGAHTVAVEPIPITFEHLRRNVVLNGLDDMVRCERIGLSDRTTTLRFTEGMDTLNRVLAPHEKSPSTEVPVTTLDQVVGVMVPTVIKVDVEGHELSVLQGARRTLADRRLLALIMETNGSGARYGVSDRTLFDLMRSYEFEPYLYNPLSRSLVGGEKENTIFIRDLAAVKSRIATARRYTLINCSI